MLTLTYLGSVRVLSGYNVMGLAKASLEANMRYMARSLGPRGIRVNAISAGPIKTLAAAGIAQFRKMLHHVEENAPLRRNITPKEVGNVAAFLCSDLASGVTGETTFVDSGYNILGMTGLDRIDLAVRLTGSACRCAGNVAAHELSTAGPRKSRWSTARAAGAGSPWPPRWRWHSQCVACRPACGCASSSVRTPSVTRSSWTTA